MDQIYFLIVVVLLLGVLYYYRIAKMNAFVDYNAMARDNLLFNKYQEEYVYKLNDLIIRDGVKINDLNKAISISTSPDNQKINLQQDPSSSYRKINQTMCSSVTSPANIPNRSVKSIFGCGWYYIDDITKPSVCTYGTKTEPLFEDELPINGEWIWDIETAQKKEEMKYCRRIKSCSLINSKAFQKFGKCGFCLNKGYAVPMMDFDNREKYPNEPQSCGDSLIADSSKCSNTILPNVSTSDGTSCEKYGRASEDGFTRVYTKEECNLLNGTFMANGDCVSPTGQIFNYECKYLNSPVKIYEQSFDLDKKCDTNKNGSISKDCLIEIAKSIGFKNDGGIIKLLSEKTAQINESILKAILNLRNAGLNIPNSALGQGNIDKDSATDVFNEIYNSLLYGNSKSIKSYASILTTGDDLNYDPCDDPQNKIEATSLKCLQRAFRQAGCQASGNAYPTSDKMHMYSGKSINAIKAEFSKLYDSINHTDMDKQDDSLLQCFGMNFSKAKPYKKMKNVWPTTNATILAGWFRGQPADYCKKLCDGNKYCKAYAYMKQPNEPQACCTVGLTTSASKIKYTNMQNLDFYAKNIITYTQHARKYVNTPSIKCGSTNNVEFCADFCNKEEKCVGYNLDMHNSKCCLQSTTGPTENQWNWNFFEKDKDL